MIKRSHYLSFDGSFYSWKFMAHDTESGLQEMETGRTFCSRETAWLDFRLWCLENEGEYFIDCVQGLDHHRSDGDVPFDSLPSMSAYMRSDAGFDNFYMSALRNLLWHDDDFYAYELTDFYGMSRVDFATRAWSFYCGFYDYIRAESMPKFCNRPNRHVLDKNQYGGFYVERHAGRAWIDDLLRISGGFARGDWTREAVEQAKSLIEGQEKPRMFKCDDFIGIEFEAV